MSFLRQFITFSIYFKKNIGKYPKKVNLFRRNDMYLSLVFSEGISYDKDIRVV